LLLWQGVNPKTAALRKRTQTFYNRVVALCQALPDTLVAQRIAPQLLDSAGSTDSNYRAACRGRSKREFIAKLGVAIEEADESIGWLEALVAARLGDSAEATALIREADELTAIFVASEKTAKRNLSDQAKPGRSSARRR
jgi:four helix bundle protein